MGNRVGGACSVGNTYRRAFSPGCVYGHSVQSCALVREHRRTLNSNMRKSSDGLFAAETGGSFVSVPKSRSWGKQSKRESRGDERPTGHAYCEPPFLSESKGCPCVYPDVAALRTTGAKDLQRVLWRSNNSRCAKDSLLNPNIDRLDPTLAFESSDESRESVPRSGGDDPGVLKFDWSSLEEALRPSPWPLRSFPLGVIGNEEQVFRGVEGQTLRPEFGQNFEKKKAADLRAKPSKAEPSEFSPPMKTELLCQLSRRGTFGLTDRGGFTGFKQLETVTVGVSLRGGGGQGLGRRGSVAVNVFRDEAWGTRGRRERDRRWVWRMGTNLSFPRDLIFEGYLFGVADGLQTDTRGRFNAQHHTEVAVAELVKETHVSEKRTARTVRALRPRPRGALWWRAKLNWRKKGVVCRLVSDRQAGWAKISGHVSRFNDSWGFSTHVSGNRGGQITPRHQRRFPSSQRAERSRLPFRVSKRSSPCHIHSSKKPA
jgi:hypothetical protein